MQTTKPLTPSELSDLKAKAKAATPGPYFAAEDEALDAPAHHGSGLALVDTGRREDWPIARLIEWKQAQFIAAANPETILRLIDMIGRRDKQMEKLRAALSGTVEAITRDTQEHCGISGYTGARLVDAREALAATEPLNDK